MIVLVAPGYEHVEEAQVGPGAGGARALGGRGRAMWTAASGGPALRGPLRGPLSSPYRCATAIGGRFAHKGAGAPLGSPSEVPVRIALFRLRSLLLAPDRPQKPGRPLPATPRPRAP